MPQSALVRMYVLIAVDLACSIPGDNLWPEGGLVGGHLKPYPLFALCMLCWICVTKYTKPTMVHGHRCPLQSLFVLLFLLFLFSSSFLLHLCSSSATGGMSPIILLLKFCRLLNLLNLLLLIGFICLFFFKYCSFCSFPISPEKIVS